MSEIELVLRAGALNGETPVWCCRRKRLFWIDVREPDLHMFDPATRTDQSWEMPAWIGCYGLTEAGAVVALRTGLFEFDLATGGLRPLAAAPFDSRRFLFNDGRCDPRGRFIAGCMLMPLRPADPRDDARQGAPLLRYAGGAEWQPITPDVQTSNGLAFSPDGRAMYHSDTKARTVWLWDYDPDSGACVNRRVFARMEDIPQPAGPDGANVDRDGFYWCAVFGAGLLRRYDPAGRLERQVQLPVRYPTMPAFGGADLQTLYVTSAAAPIAQEARRSDLADGGLFALPAPAPGLPEPRISSFWLKGV
jgi:sugar lactone lactonase YvrE